MPTVLQFRRGTTVQNNAFTGSAGEITVDSQIGTLRVHDGSTEGGNELLKIDGSNASDFNTITMTGNILSSNGTQEIGSSGTPFQAVYATTFTGTATSAEYADLAEIYSADANYAPGVVVVIGGSAEVTICNTENDHRVAGVVTTNPAHLMNSNANYEYNCAVALTGRVPCKVTGVISKGDLLTTATFGRAQSNNNAKPGTIIGKALEDFSGENGIINILVGKH